MIVLFDLDGTLCDHAGADREAALALRAVVAPERPPEMFLADWRAARARQTVRWRSGLISFSEQRRARVREVLGKRLGDAEADLAFNFYSAAYRRAWRLFDDVRPCFAAFARREARRDHPWRAGDAAAQDRRPRPERAF